MVDPRLSVRVALVADSQKLISRFLAHLRRETAVDVLKLVGQSTEHPRRASLAMAADFDLDGFLDRAGFAHVRQEVGNGKEKRVVALWLTGESQPLDAPPKQAGPRKKRGTT